MLPATIRTLLFFFHLRALRSERDHGIVKGSVIRPPSALCPDVRKRGCGSVLVLVCARSSSVHREHRHTTVVRPAAAALGKRVQGRTLASPFRKRYDTCVTRLHRELHTFSWVPAITPAPPPPLVKHDFGGYMRGRFDTFPAETRTLPLSKKHDSVFFCVRCMFAVAPGVGICSFCRAAVSRR